MVGTSIQRGQGARNGSNPGFTAGFRGFRCRIFPGCVAILLLVSMARESVLSHPFSVLELELTVGEERGIAELIVTVEDYYWAYELTPDSQGNLDSLAVAQSVERYREKALGELELKDADGNALKGEIVAVRILDGVSPEDLSKSLQHRVAYEIEYSFDLPPIGLEVTHHFGGKQSTFPSIVKLIVTQDGFPPDEPRLVEKEQVAALSFDWQATPPAEGRGEEPVRRTTSSEQGEFGIRSYGSVYSFCYIEASEVRHEILIPLATLETWMDVERRKPSVLEVDEQDAVRERLFGFFSSYNSVEINGREVKPELVRMNFFDLDLKDFAVNAPPRAVPAYAARVGLILSYPASSPPERVELSWDLFSRSVLELRTALYFGSEARQVVLTRGNPILSWTGPETFSEPNWLSIPPPRSRSDRLRIPGFSVVAFGALLVALPWLRPWRGRGWGWIPIVVLVAVGGATWNLGRVEIGGLFVSEPVLPEASELRRIVEPLLQNVYRSFAERGEEEIYASLARSVDGSLLDDLYVEIRRGLSMQEQGGAISRVRSVELLGCRGPEVVAEEEGRGGFRLDCSWKVRGTVEHWGHVHTRTNRYDARAEVVPQENSWRITGFEVLGQERLSFTTSVREVGDGRRK